MEDKYTDPVLHETLWDLFDFPSAMTHISAEERTLCEAKIDRCRRIKENWDTIRAESRASVRRIWKERGHPVREEHDRGERMDHETLKRLIGEKLRRDGLHSARAKKS
jgi:hypothetical protein